MTPVDIALYQHADKAERRSLQNTSNWFGLKYEQTDSRNVLEMEDV